MNAFEGPEGWAVVGNPVHERYLEPTPATQETTKLGELNEFWQSQPFRRWLSQVTGYSMSSIILENEKDQAGVEIKPRTTVKLRRFRPGFDYTLATPSSTSMIDLIYECTPTPWSDPQLGGYRRLKPTS
ncbi:hypothetical protein HMI54_014107 [Coelomomyces lativittatus]|nr:hypothetical protein HMI54_014107 [Coelomomyces lativittatus]